MKIITDTKRLILRELSVEDAESFFMLNTDPLVLKYTGDLPFRSVKEATIFLKNYSEYRKNGFGRWAVVKKENEKFIGWCGLKLNEESFIDLGFRFFRNEWGKGFATEAAKATIDYGFNVLGIKEIIGRAIPLNLASIRVLEKIQMKYWKTDYVDGLEMASLYRITKNKLL